MGIYQKINNYIKKNNLSYECIAKKSNISPKDLQAMMNGKQTLYPEDLRAICYALNVKPEKFM